MSNMDEIMAEFTRFDESQIEYWNGQFDGD